jgi:hypothetical protein
VNARNLFREECVREIKIRLVLLLPDSARQWGTMSPAQMLAHCSAGLLSAMGEIRPRRILLGRIIGPAVKSVAFRDEEPMRRNVPTAKEFIVAGNPDFGGERDRLNQLIDRFASGGPARCTSHPHMFFGRLTPGEWAILSYKHLDHHLRQFGV